MKKIKYILFIALGFMCFGMVVHADSCGYDTQAQLNNLASNVNAEGINYILRDENYYDESAGGYITLDEWYDAIYIYNLDDSLYAKVTGDNFSKTYTSANKSSDGIVYVGAGDASVVRNYTIEIYPVDKSCGTTPIKSLSVTLRRYNQYYMYPECTNNPNFYYCNELTTVNQITDEQFYEGITKYQNGEINEDGETTSEFKNNSSFFVQHIFFFLNAFIVLLIVGIIIVILRKKVLLRKRGV